MHAFLLSGHTDNNFADEINILTKKTGAKIFEYPLLKIDDVRNLNGLLKMSFAEPTLVVCKNISEASEEAMNAFLKNLEEPQNNIYFVLTTSNLKKVLPTIVSRCQIITPLSLSNIVNSPELSDFVKMTKSNKLKFLDKYKGREEAVSFIENLIFFLHSQKDFRNLEILIDTLTGLKNNGIVSLHLTNLVARMENA